MDREKVIKEYEEFVDKYECFCSSDDYVFEMHKAVLALLKEQEAVAPNPVHNSYRWFTCGKCDCSITNEDRFCPRCGRAVKWE